MSSSKQRGTGLPRLMTLWGTGRRASAQRAQIPRGPPRSRSTWARTLLGEKCCSRWALDFHDGTVGEGLYEADLPLTLVATFEAMHVLARAIFSEMGAARDCEVTVNCDRWLLRLGPGTGQAQLVQVDEVTASTSGTSGTPGTSGTQAPNERGANQWLRGVAALRQADHPQALAAFEAEAAAALAAGSPQRAAVAFRAAAASARSIGRADQSNRSHASPESPTWTSPKARTPCLRACSALIGKLPALSSKQGTSPWPSNA